MIAPSEMREAMSFRYALWRMVEALPVAQSAIAGLSQCVIYNSWRSIGWDFPWSAGLEDGLSKSNASLLEGEIVGSILLSRLAKSVG